MCLQTPKCCPSTNPMLLISEQKETQAYRRGLKASTCMHSSLFKQVMDTSENLAKPGPKRFYSVYFANNSSNLLANGNSVFLLEI